MQQLALVTGQEAFTADVAVVPEQSRQSRHLDDAALMEMPLVEAKRLVASAFERRYLIRVMERAGGSVSEAARLSGLDRTNFRRLLQRHDLR